MLPEVGIGMPVKILRMVGFPAPFCSMILRVSSSATSKLIFLRHGTSGESYGVVQPP
jgi:hypothetical protein